MELLTICTLIASVCTYIGYRLYQYRKRFNVFIELGIPGPQPSFIRGNVKDLKVGSKLPVESTMKWQQQYGKVYGYFRGSTPTLVVADPELMKQILIKDFSNFINRPQAPVNIKINLKSLVSLQDNEWKDVRKTLSPTFSASKMKQLTTTMNKRISMLCEILESKCKQGEEFDIYDNFQRLTLDVIGECAMAIQINCQTHHNDVVFKTVQVFMKGIKSPILNLLEYVPGMATLINIPFQYLPPVKKVEALLEQIRSVVRQRRSENKQKTVDVLQLMLEAGHETEIILDDEDVDDNQSIKYPFDNKKQRKPLSEDHIVANSWIFLLAGFETTATALAYTAHLLTHHPDIQESLYQEIIANIQDDRIPTYEDANNLKYLDQVINETLRLYPPVVLFMTRICARDYNLNGVVIPAGMKVEIPIYSIHHDPEIWPDPEKFNPERFSPENKSKIHPMAHIPFGAGPRNCIGMRFALLETKLTLIRLLRTYRLVPSSKTKDPPEITVPHATFVPKNGIFLKVERRT